MSQVFLAFEGFLLGYGLVMLIRGKGGFSPNETASGPAARIAGLLLMVPFAVGLIASAALNEPWGPTAVRAADSTASVIEMVAIFICCTAALLIMLNAHQRQRAGG